MPQLDIITFSSSYVWFLFITPLLIVKFIGVIVILLRFIMLLVSIHDIMSSILKGFYDKHTLFFIPLKCFLAMYGSYIVMFTMILYFYTVTFPAIIAPTWLPFVVVMRLNAIIRRSKQFLNYLENRRTLKLELEIEQLYRKKQSETFLLAGGWSLVSSSTVDKFAVGRKAAKIQGIVQFPPLSSHNPRLYEKNNVLAIAESSRLGQHVSKTTGLSLDSQTVREVVRGALARRNHARLGIWNKYSDLSITYGLSTKKNFRPKVSTFNNYEGSITAVDVSIEELGNCFIKGKTGPQYLITKPVQIHPSSGNIMSVNEFIEQFPYISDEFFYDPALRAALLRLSDQCGDFLWQLNGLSLEERCRFIANAKTQGLPKDINDYSTVSNSDYEGVITVVMDLFS